MAKIPNKDEFVAGVAAYDGNNCVYFEGLLGLQQGWGDPARMADAIWPLLRNWHTDFYRYGNGDPQAIASAIAQNIEPLNALRNRTIDTLCAADEPTIRALFWAIAKATGRTNSKGFQASSVGCRQSYALTLAGLFAALGYCDFRSLPLRTGSLWIHQVLPNHEGVCRRSSALLTHSRRSLNIEKD